MTAFALFAAVQHLATRTYSFSDGDLGQPYQWRAHREGVRFALIGTYHELRELAVQLGQRRAVQGPPLTFAQRALAPYHAAYRDLQALLLGVDEETWNRAPAPTEWPLRRVVVHILHAERTFFALVHHTLASRPSPGTPPLPLPPDIHARLFDDAESFTDYYETGSRADVMENYAALHRRALAAFAPIDDDVLQAPSLWWEGEAYPLLYRLHRFDAHLRQHTVQAEKVLADLGRPPTEARRLLRLVYQALAEVESVRLGADEVGAAACRALAEQIEARAEVVAERVRRAGNLRLAVTAGEEARVRELLDADPVLVDALDEQGVPLRRLALYRGRPEIAADFVERGARLSLMDGAALGRRDVVEEAVAEWPGWVNEYSADGFTPLQLACFFGHEPVARYLLAQGADVEAVARNPQQIRPLHAAVAGPAAPALVALLLEHGADPDARQQQAFTALHTAAQAGDRESVRLLLEHGADPAPLDEQGRTPAVLARSQGYDALARLLDGAATAPG